MGRVAGAFVKAHVKPDAPGAHVVGIHMLGPGVVLDNVVPNTGGRRPGHPGPPETEVVSKQAVATRPTAAD